MASGEPTPTSVLLWTRVTADAPDADVVVAWDLAHARSGLVVARGEAVASPDADHTVHVDVEGLDPGERYVYGFSTGDERAVGRTATLPERSERIRIGVVCCARWGWNDFGAYGRLADDAPDLVLYLGDYIYEVGELPPAGTPTRPFHACRTLADYRTRFAQHREHPALRRLHAEAPMLALWDDHEVANNAPTDDGERARARRAAGMQAWSEWMPVRAGDRSRPLDRSASIAGLLDLTMVDARFSGRLPADTDGPSTPRDDDPAILNVEQWSALEDRIVNAQAPWHLVANQVQVAPTRLGYVPSARPPFVRPLVNPDQWDGFPAERARLYAALADRRAHPVLLSGDLHSAWSREIRHRRRTIAHELTCPSVAGASYADAFRSRARLPAAVLRWALRLFNRGVTVMELDRHGHLVLDVTADRIDATFVLDAPAERVRVTIDRGGRRTDEPEVLLRDP